MSDTERTVLMFGASGFTGRHLAGCLAKSGRWIVKDARALGADLTDIGSLARAVDSARPDAVVNLAARSSVTESDLRLLYDVNAFGWRNLLTVLVERQFRGRVIFASSANIYGNKTDGLIVEQRAPDPANHYGLSKVLAERFSLLDGVGLDLVTTRPFNCIGVGQAPGFLVPKLVAHFAERRPRIELGALDVERDFVDIRDAAAAYRLLLEADAPPPVVHIASGRAVSIQALIDILRGLTGHAMEVAVNQAFIRPNDLRYQCGDVSRLAALGFIPRYTVTDTLSWMLSAQPTKASPRSELDQAR